jgi:hypothetical protein
MELAVGDSTEIELVFNSGRYKGIVHKSANVMLNDTAASIVRISLSAEVVENPDSTFPLVISPPRLDFTPVEGKKVMEKQVKIRNISQEEIRVKVVDSPFGFSKIKLSDEKIKPSEEIDLKVRVNRELKEDSFKKSITLELNDKTKTRFTIPVKREAGTQKER